LEWELENTKSYEPKNSIYCIESLIIINTT
jgi:hypothetical protein